MSNSRSLSAADPYVAERCRLLQEEFARRFAPWCLVITSVARDAAVQEALYAQGRVASKMELNALRERAGLAPIHDEAEAHRVVTWVRTSKHNRVPSEAVDLAVALDPDGPDGPIKPRIDWEDISRYEAMGEIAKRLGLVWGGDWRKPDYCHVEKPRESAAQKEEHR